MLFGSTAATNVTVVDDSHVTAVVPAGTGTVDVRVQSGVTVSDSQNIKNPIFGYGISAVTSADRFTYGGTTGNQPPTVAQAASATPNPVTGTTTSLAVLGADDGGEANLVYGWQATAEPSGASPAFSANGTNAAKNTVVTFNRAGAYTFKVTITDSGGLTVPARERLGEPDVHEHRGLSLERHPAGPGPNNSSQHRRSTSSASPWRPSRASHGRS